MLLCPAVQAKPREAHDIGGRDGPHGCGLAQLRHRLTRVGDAWIEFAVLNPICNPVSRSRLGGEDETSGPTISAADAAALVTLSRLGANLSDAAGNLVAPFPTGGGDLYGRGIGKETRRDAGQSVSVPLPRPTQLGVC